jgi:hypothetical protein
MRSMLCFIVMFVGCTGVVFAQSVPPAIFTAGGTRVTAAHLETDQSYSDRRIALESIVITWLSGLN